MRERGLRLVVLEGLRQLECCGAEMTIGFDAGHITFTASPGTTLPLATVRWSSEGWTVLPEAQGPPLQLDGIPIPDRVPVRFRPGTRMRAGSAEWLVLPLDWLVLRCDALLLFGPYAAEFGCAQFHSGIPLVEGLTAMNLGMEPSLPAASEWNILGYAGSCGVPIPAMSPGERIEIESPNLRLDPDELRSISVARAAVLHARLHAKTTVEAEFPLTFLGAWEWSYDSCGPAILPAFVSPRDGTVEGLVLAAQDDGRKSGVAPFHALLRAQAEGERCLARRLYDYLGLRCGLSYIPPDVGPDRSMARQSIRPPYRIFSGGVAGGGGHGACLDLALLYAGCIENVGLCPVLVLTGVLPGDPQHVLGGWWAGRTCGGRSLLTNLDGLRREVDEGNLVLIECTGFAEGAFARGKLSFEEACAAAARHLIEVPWAVAVDIVALRPPLGAVTPMEWPLTPEVDRAYRLARSFAESKGRAVVETTYLLYGMLSAGGEVTRWLFEALGSDSGRVCRELERRVPDRESDGEPIPTRRTHECMRRAAQFAWRGGVASVREQDLLWALLRAAEEPNSALQGTCDKLRLDPRVLGATLAQRFRPSDGPSQGGSMPSMGLE